MASIFDMDEFSDDLDMPMQREVIKIEPEQPKIRPTKVNQVRDRDMDKYLRFVDDEWRSSPVVDRHRGNATYHFPQRPQGHRFVTLTDSFYEAHLHQRDQHRLKFKFKHEEQEELLAKRATCWPFYYQEITKHPETWIRDVDIVREEGNLQNGAFPANFVPEFTRIGMMNRKGIRTVPQPTRGPLLLLRADKRVQDITRQPLPDTEMRELSPSLNSVCDNEDSGHLKKSSSEAAEANQKLYKAVYDWIDRPALLMLTAPDQKDLLHLSIQLREFADRRGVQRQFLQNIFVCAALDRGQKWMDESENDVRDKIFDIYQAIIGNYNPRICEEAVKEETSIYALRAFAIVASVLPEPPTGRLKFVDLFLRFFEGNEAGSMATDKRKSSSDIKRMLRETAKRADPSAAEHPDFGCDALYYGVLSCTLAYLKTSGGEPGMDSMDDEVVRLKNSVPRFIKSPQFDELFLRFLWNRSAAADPATRELLIKFTLRLGKDHKPKRLLSDELLQKIRSKAGLLDQYAIEALLVAYKNKE